MWALLEAAAGVEAKSVPVGHLLEKTAVYAYFESFFPATLSVEEIVPVPGCDPREEGHGRYWLTGTVGEDVRVKGADRQSSKQTPQFLLTVGNLRFVGTPMEPHPRDKVKPGSRVTVQCLFRLPNEAERERDEVPEEWCSDWQVLDREQFGELGDLLDLEPPAAKQGDSKASERRRRTPLLLATDYGCGPLWYRDADNKAPWGLDLGFFPFSDALRDRLVRWTAGDYHLAFDYEDDDPEHEMDWHNEGLALLAELRRELGPGYDIKFAHDLDA